MTTTALDPLRQLAHRLVAPIPLRHETEVIAIQVVAKLHLAAGLPTGKQLLDVFAAPLRGGGPALGLADVLLAHRLVQPVEDRRLPLQDAAEVGAGDFGALGLFDEDVAGKGVAG